MFEKALWPTVVLVSVVCAAVTALLVVGVDVVDIIAAFAIAGNVLQLMLYGKVQKIESNTNGMLTERDRMVRDLVEHTKHTVPFDSVIKNGDESGK